VIERDSVGPNAGSCQTRLVLLPMLAVRSRPLLDHRSPVGVRARGRRQPLPEGGSVISWRRELWDANAGPCVLTVASRTQCGRLLLCRSIVARVTRDQASPTTRVSSSGWERLGLQSSSPLRVDNLVEVRVPFQRVISERSQRRVRPLPRTTTGSGISGYLR
jgi:hypothetical protein